MFRFFKSKCGMCKRKARAYQTYQIPTGKKMKLCLACSEYAERRAYKKVYAV